MNQNDNGHRSGPPAGDWIKLHRQVLDSQVFCSPKLLKVWIWCLCKATWRKTWITVSTGRGETEVKLRPGQFVFGRHTAAESLRMKPSTIRNLMQKLTKLGNLDIQPDSHFSVVSVRNWALYQGIPSDEDRQQNSQRTGKGQAKDTNKKDKKVKNHSSSRPKLRFDEEDMLLSRWMFDLIRQLQPGRKEPSFEKWANTIRTMREQDGRTDEDIRDLFGRANRDEFWQANILSPEKLREKFDDLDLKLRRPSRGQPPGGAGTPSQGGRPGRPMGPDSPARIR